MKKRILSRCFLAVTLLLAASCNDFLTEDPKGRLTPNNFFSNQNELDMSVYALYSKVQELQCNSNPIIPQCQGDDVTSTTGSNKAAYLSADAFEYSYSAGIPTHSSKAIAIVEARLDWILMLSSGPIKIFLPSR